MASEQEIKVPDIGGVSGVDVIELLVKAGDVIEKDSPLVTLETDKASMEIPSPSAGVVREMRLKVGDKVSEGDVILLLSMEEAAPIEKKPEPVPAKPDVVESAPEVEERTVPFETVRSTEASAVTSTDLIAAGPGVRRLAHELGVNLSDVHGSGRKSRISKKKPVQLVFLCRVRPRLTLVSSEQLRPSL